MQLDIAGRAGKITVQEKKKQDENIFACFSSIQHFIPAFGHYFPDANVRPAKACFWHGSGAEFVYGIVALLEYRIEISAARCHLHISCTITFSGNLNFSLNTACFKQ